MCQLRRFVAIAALLSGVLVPSVAVACLWDYDTIKMERSRFPDTLELITGKFLRHTPEFYQWRIRDRLKRLESAPTSAALLDDLAVAYDKTGQHDQAIETALRTESSHPGRYETAANLGTLYIHAGRPEEGIPHIDRALALNPNAHFGREKYQKLLVEYVLSRRKGGPLKLPLAEVTVHAGKNPDSPSAHEATIKETFATWLRKDPHQPLSPDETAAAVKGILGMMRFGKHDSPALLEALGTLLAQEKRNRDADAKLLAARALLKASYDVPDGPARVAYRAMAAQAIEMQTPRHSEHQIPLEQVEVEFQKELDEGRAWYEKLRDRELSWIRDGTNPEAEFDRLYAADPVVSGMEVRDPLTPGEWWKRLFLIGGIVILVVFVAGPAATMLLLRRDRSRRARSLG